MPKQIVKPDYEITIAPFFDKPVISEEEMQVIVDIAKMCGSVYVDYVYVDCCDAYYWHIRTSNNVKGAFYNSVEEALATLKYKKVFGEEPILELSAKPF